MKLKPERAYKSPSHTKKLHKIASHQPLARTRASKYRGRAWIKRHPRTFSHCSNIISLIEINHPVSQFMIRLPHHDSPTAFKSVRWNVIVLEMEKIIDNRQRKITTLSRKRFSKLLISFSTTYIIYLYILKVNATYNGGASFTGVSEGPGHFHGYYASIGGGDTTMEGLK